MKKLLPIICLLMGLGGKNHAQQTFPFNGVEDHRERFYALTGATVFSTYDKKVENATLLIRDGKVVSVLPSGPVPEGAVQVSLKGKTVYPAFIDLYSSYGMPEPKAEGKEPEQRPQMLSNKAGAYAWNEALKPEFRAHEFFTADEKTAAAYRQQGFGLLSAHRMDGISRGTSTLVALGDERPHEMIVKERAGHHLSFRKGTSTQDYPNSLMGIIALLRQTYYDGQWYGGQDEEVNISLQAWNAVQDLPQVFEVGDRLEALRAARLGKEFGKTYIIKGEGDEYQRLEAIKATGSAFILPLNFPKPYDVEDPYDALQVNLEQMKHWEMAPANPGKLAAAGIEIALTAEGLEDKKDFLEMLRKAVSFGLPEEAALKALTHTPARLMGASQQAGSLEAGKWANFFITDGNIFDKDTRILHSWIKGKAYVLENLDAESWLGVFDLIAGDKTYKLTVEGEAAKPKMTIQGADTTSIKAQYSREDALISLSFQPEKGGKQVRLSGLMEGAKWSGKGQDENGRWVEWSATYTGAADGKDEDEAEKEDDEQAEAGTVTYPFTAYGWAERPRQETYLIKNATVWTNEAEGILENTDLLVRSGKIAQVGQGLNIRGAIVIDAGGKHLTPGIIDEHSHIAVSRSVNEGTQASSAEVRIGDVINSEDINIYRQLSGGVTSSQILHGSANPIGGQSALIKLRWGYTPEEMKFEGADGFIKFALGENVKQSNWGDDNTIRFPQTRMGVEQVYADHFTRAREYGKLKASGKAFRKDLEMEALLEILEGKRFITCHSYRQSEINMLMKVAEQFGFRVNTFTHTLEGYKVADKMAEHGAGGSSFSDWWAYKYEVMEAIPYNGALMHGQGVTVAFNSDDAEMARRLNQEAAKAVLFGGVPEEEALKFVTLNPAKLLHIDERVGSIKVGKDADLVVWSDHPLSMYAVAEKTFVDGILFFNRDEEAKKREAIAAERLRLIGKMLAGKQKGEKTQSANGKRQYEQYHCDDNEDEAR